MERKSPNEFGSAAENGDLRTIQCMLTGENPVPVDCFCRHRRDFHYEYVTPLFLACKGGHLAIVQESIHAGADVNWKQMKYKTPPDDEVSFQNCGNIKLKIFTRMAFVNATAICVGTPLHNACSYYTTSPEVVEALLAVGADVNATVYDAGANGVTPLMSLTKSRAPITSRIEIA